MLKLKEGSLIVAAIGGGILFGLIASFAQSLPLVVLSFVGGMAIGYLVSPWLAPRSTTNPHLVELQTLVEQISNTSRDVDDVRTHINVSSATDTFQDCLAELKLKNSTQVESLVPGLKNYLDNILNVLQTMVRYQGYTQTPKITRFMDSAKRGFVDFPKYAQQMLDQAIEGDMAKMKASVDLMEFVDVPDLDDLMAQGR